MASVKIDAGRYDDGLKLVLEFLEYKSDRWMFLNAAECYYELGDKESAKQMYQNAKVASSALNLSKRTNDIRLNKIYEKRASAIKALLYE